MRSAQEDTYVTLDICLRSAVNGVIEARQEEVLDRIQQLERNGVIDEARVHYWSGRATVPDDGARNDSGCPDIVEELYDVTAESQLSLEPFFREQSGTDGHRSVLYLPVVCLVVRRNGDVVGIYPSTRRDSHQSIQTGLDALATDGEWANLGRRTDAGSVS